MSASLKELAAKVRRVWSPPERHAMGLDDVAILRLIKAIEDGPEPVDVGRLFDEEIAAADRMRDGEVSDHPQTKYDGHQLGEALRRIKGRLR